MQNPTHIYALPGTYTVTLTATNCISSNTTTFVLTVGPNGIDENLNALQISVFPNPFTDQFTINSSLFPAVVNVYNLLGEQVSSMKLETKMAKLKTGDLSAGVYFVKVSAKGVEQVVKVVKQ